MSTEIYTYMCTYIYINIYIYIYIYIDIDIDIDIIYQAHIHVLKVKSRITRSPGTSSVSYLGSQPARIYSKKLRVWTAMLLVEALALTKCLLGEIKYI